jgi:hypothetical protein
VFQGDNVSQICLNEAVADSTTSRLSSSDPDHLLLGTTTSEVACPCCLEWLNCSLCCIYIIYVFVQIQQARLAPQASLQTHPSCSTTTVGQGVLASARKSLAFSLAAPLSRSCQKSASCKAALNSSSDSRVCRHCHARDEAIRRCLLSDMSDYCLT